MKIIKYFTLYFKILSLKIMRMMTFKGQYFIYSFASLLFSFFSIIFGVIIYSVSNGIPGWSFGEYLIFAGSWIFIRHLANVFPGRANYYITGHVRKGTLDGILTKPVDMVPFALFNGVDATAMVDVVLSLVVIILGLINIGYVFTWASFLAYILFVFLGLVVWSSLSLGFGSLSIFFVRSDFAEVFYNMFRFTSSWPLSIYSHSVQLIFSFVLPVGIVSFYPATVLLGRFDYDILPALCAVTFTFGALMWAFFNFALSRYTSAGG